VNSPLEAGALVVVDWRDALPGEANKARPAVVVASSEMIDLPVILLVPLGGEAAPRIPGAFIAIEPTASNGCTKRSYALAHLVTATARARIVQFRERGSRPISSKHSTPLYATSSRLNTAADEAQPILVGFRPC